MKVFSEYNIISMSLLHRSPF